MMYRKVYGMKKKVKRNRNGSAIIMAMVTMMVLLLLGLAVATVSMGTLRTNVADAVNNDAYYAAESAVASAIEQLKYEVSAYYADMLEASSSECGTLYSAFFEGINQNAKWNFHEPSFNGIITSTTFTTGSYDSEDEVCEFLVSCTAKADNGTRYRVDGALYVKKVDVRTTSAVWLEIDDAALKAGGTIALGSTNGMSISGGNVYTSALTYTRSWLPYNISGGQLILSPGVAATINDCLTYPSYSDPVMSDIDLYCTANTTVNWSNVPAATVGITTAPGVTLTVTSCTVPAGIIYGRGNTVIKDCNVYSDVYSDGTLSISNQSLYGDVHCRGNLTISNCTVYGDVYCDGTVTFYSAALKGSIFSSGAIKMNDGSMTGSLLSMSTVTVSSASIVKGIVYSHTKIYCGNMSASAVFFSGGDIEITGSMSLSGAMIAKGNIGFGGESSRWLTISYSHSKIQDVMSNENNAAMFSISGGQPKLDEDVFVRQSITAQGRLS